MDFLLGKNRKKEKEENSEKEKKGNEITEKTGPRGVFYKLLIIS